MKTLKSILIFGAFTAVFFVGMLVVLAKVQYKDVSLLSRTNLFYSIKGNNEYKRFHEFDENKIWDVLVMGSSHAYRGYNPTVFENNGYSCYNLGSSGQTIRETYHIISNMKKHPKLYVIDLHVGSFESDGVESASRLIANVKDDQLAAAIAFDEFNWMLSLSFAKRKIESQYPPIFKEAEEDTVHYYNGFAGRNEKVKEGIDYKSIGKNFIPTSFGMEYLDKLVTYLKENDLRAVFVTHPQPEAINHNQMNEFSDAIKDKLNEDFLYFNYAFSLTNQFNTFEDFYDSHHLNLQGSNKFTELLLNDLTDSGLLK